jgi:tetrahydromethanopterin S-methyltransferase subunit F
VTLALEAALTRLGAGVAGVAVEVVLAIVLVTIAVLLESEEAF